MPSKIRKSENGIKIEDGGVYCQGPVTSTTATARHLNRTPMHGVLVAGHLKGFYKKYIWNQTGQSPIVENSLKYSKCFNDSKTMNEKDMLGRSLTWNTHLSTICALLTYPYPF